MNFPAHPYAQQQPQQQAVPPPRREVDPNNPASVASDILARVSAYDSTAPRPESDLIRRWAEVIRASGVTYEHLKEGVIRVYSTASEPPKMKLAAVVAAAKDVRRDARKGESIRELGPALVPSFDDDSVKDGVVGYALLDAYNVDGAVGLPCDQCGAPAGEWCEQELEGRREIRKIPCTARLSRAYRTNSPKGRARHEARERRLAEHRQTWQPPWKNQPNY